MGSDRRDWIALLACAASAAVVSAGACGLPTEGTASTATSAGGGGASTTSSASSGASSAGGGDAGGQGGGGVGGAGGTAGSGGVGIEICTNSADDDGDGDVDCDDMDCADHACVDALPDGGTYVVRPMMKSCAAGYALTTIFECDACACSACMLDVSLYDGDGDCSGNPISTFKFDPATGCFDVEPNLTTSSNGFGFDAEAGSGACSVDEASMTIELCATPAGSCERGAKACVPQAPNVDDVCVLTDGDCEEPYTDERDITEGADASVCGCSCSGSIACDEWLVSQYRDGDDCSGHSHSTPADGTCGGSNDQTFKSFGAVYTGSSSCTSSSNPPSPTKKLCCK